MAPWPSNEGGRHVGVHLEVVPHARKLRRSGVQPLIVAAIVIAGLLTGCGEREPAPDDAVTLSTTRFNRTAYENAIGGGEVSVSARLLSPTNDGDGDVRVEVDRRPPDMTIRLAVSISRESGQVAFEVMEVSGKIYLRKQPADADSEWIFTDDNADGADALRLSALAEAFPVVGDIVGAVRADGWTEHGTEPCPSIGMCFVLTNPAYEFASLYVDAETYWPLHIRLARPGMRAAGEIAIDWMAAEPVEPPTNARAVDLGQFETELGPVLQTIGL